MDYKTLINFIAVVENGSITRAAEALHISQPPLTKQMQALEKELGITLFTRSSKGVKLTAKGEILYKHALHLLALNDSIVNELKKPEIETINIGFITSSVQYSVAMIQKYAELNNVNFAITEKNSFELIDYLEKRIIDLAIIRTPFDMTDNFRCIKLTEEELVAVGKSEFFHEDSDTVSLSFLRESQLIAIRRWSNHIASFGNSMAKKIHFKFICDDNRTSMALAEKGLGIAIVPSSVINFGTKNTDLQVKNIESNMIKTSLYMIYDHSKPLSKASQDFVDFILKTID